MMSKGQLDEDEYERRLRLILLTYEVLKDMETPTDEASSVAMFTLLSRAFFDNATTLALGALLRSHQRATKPRGQLESIR
jgi:hypothetical protein